MLFKKLSAELLRGDDFSDGAQKEIPDGTVALVEVTGGFCGVRPGKSLKSFNINIKVCEGEFSGQSYSKNFSDLMSIDPGKEIKKEKLSDQLSKIDYQAGYPFANLGLQLNTDNIERYLSGAVLLAKFGVFVNDDDERIQFIRGFAVSPEHAKKEIKSSPEGSDDSDWD